ncbi:PP2C family protein-serine/threonine phosphatase [Streptomyces sp. NPDC056600]|uniref:PP2C family protein-serine/threonine phosphatase n=1 Tax=Streptomyces sp. NPDC056600 TaxID=3345874 RepID=UPI0036B2643A
MGVCDAFARYAPARKPDAMSAPHPPKVAGFDSPLPSSAPASPTVPPVAGTPSCTPPPRTGAVPDAPARPAGTRHCTEPRTLLEDRLAGRIADLASLHDLTRCLVRTGTVRDALREILHAGARLLGARRGLAVLDQDGPPGEYGPHTPVGHGLTHEELGQLETVPAADRPQAPLTTDPTLTEVARPDLTAEVALTPRHREVADRLGYAAAYAHALDPHDGSRLGAAVWLFDGPAVPGPAERRTAAHYLGLAGDHLARLLEVDRARARLAALAEGLLPSRLPTMPGVRLAVRHRTGPLGGGDWFDALPLPEGALGLAVGSVAGSGPQAVAARGRLRAALRAYAVMEGEDPVAVLSDLELMLRLTEPGCPATALFAHCRPGGRRLTLAGAGHNPPLVLGDRRAEFVETGVSAPLGMLGCWEAPGAEVRLDPGETVLLWTDGLLRRTGDPVDRAFARLHRAAAGVPRRLRDDPETVADHVLQAMLPDGRDATDGADDMVLLAARFD